MESLEQTLRRLDREREEADRRYNDALTALDRALPRPGEWPSPSRTVDDSQLPSINDAWNIAGAAPAAQPGWRGRLSGFIWRTVAPYLQQQTSFNSRLVDHLNRNAAAANEAHRRAEETTARLRDEFGRLAEFHARTIEYLQQMTAYIDTRDRRAAGGALVLNASLSGLAENVDKRWESLSAQQARVNAGFTDLSARLVATSDELRTMVGVAQQGTLSLKREVEKLSGRNAPEVQAGRASFFQPWTATSTWDSRISFVGRARTSARGWRAICRLLPAPPTSSMSDAGAESFWSCSPEQAFGPRAST